MSHYKPYPAYKDSGVKWLGRVPEHWDTQRIRSLIDSAQNGIWGDDPDGGVDDIPCARVADFDRNSFTVKGELPTLRKVPEAQRLSRQVNPGDLLIEKSGGGEQTTVGVVVQYQGVVPVICSNFVAVVKPKKGVFPRWLCYINAHLYSVGVNVRSIKQTTGIQNIDSDQYFSERVAVPPESERQAISAHLDRETARIDALIEKKTRFIELLREKRQALITHAVTKGLSGLNAPCASRHPRAGGDPVLSPAPLDSRLRGNDGEVRMKDSGVEWLGEVPEHWVIKRFRDICISISTGPFGTALGNEDYVTGGIPVINPSHIVDEQCSPDPDITVSADTAERLSFWAMRVGDLVTARRGELGRSAVIFNEQDGWICGTGSLRVRPDPSQALTGYLHTVLQSRYAREWLNLASVGATMANLNEGILGNLPLALPPSTAEQEQLLSSLATQSERLIKLEQKATLSVALLKERRAALITAAVTGQIDLREAV